MSKYLNDIDVKSSVGVVCKSKSFGDFRILEYKGYNNVVIEFLETGYQKLCQNKEIKTGAVKDKLLPTVLGVGIVGDKGEKQYTIETAAAQTDESRHAGVVPTIDEAFFDQGDQFAFAHDHISQIQTIELVLMWKQEEVRFNGCA